MTKRDMTSILSMLIICLLMSIALTRPTKQQWTHTFFGAADKWTNVKIAKQFVAQIKYDENSLEVNNHSQYRLVVTLTNKIDEHVIGIQVPANGKVKHEIDKIVGPTTWNSQHKVAATVSLIPEGGKHDGCSKSRLAVNEYTAEPLVNDFNNKAVVNQYTAEPAVHELEINSHVNEYVAKPFVNEYETEPLLTWASTVGGPMSACQGYGCRWQGPF